MECKVTNKCSNPTTKNNSTVFTLAPQASTSAQHKNNIEYQSNLGSKVELGLSQGR